MTLLRKILLFALFKPLIASCLIALLLMPCVFAEAISNYQQKSQFQQALEKINSLSADELEIDSVPFCRSYTCREIVNIKITSEDWQQATQLLNKKPRTAFMERALLAEIYSRLEVIASRAANTQYDIGGTFKVEKMPRVDSAQLDCVDESFNMFVFLNLLNNDGKLYWHKVGNIVHRGWLFDLDYPHTALTLVDKNTQEQYVIDSWFHDSGRPPELVSLHVWKSGWVPEGFN